MRRKLNLVVKSEKQYYKAIEKLSELGGQSFALMGYDERKVGVDDYGVGCFITPDKFLFTDGTSSDVSGWENFYTVKSFIKAVELALGEAK